MNVRRVVNDSQRVSMSLLVDFCDHKAAAHAMKRWHYSDMTPIGRLVKLGVWEDKRFIGAVIFARGGSSSYGDRFNIERTEVCELVRVALTDHTAPVTQIVTQALRRLQDSSPGLRVVMSFADSGQGHLGIIYQAGNWTYLGTTTAGKEYFLRGKWTHERTLSGKTMGIDRVAAREGMTYPELRKSLVSRPTSVKFRYAYPLDKKMRRLLNTMSLPYPTADDLAAQVSEAIHRPSGSEGQVRSLGAAPHLIQDSDLMDVKNG